jgi:hypothetical protein
MVERTNVTNKCSEEKIFILKSVNRLILLHSNHCNKSKILVRTQMKQTNTKKIFIRKLIATYHGVGSMSSTTMICCMRLPKIEMWDSISFICLKCHSLFCGSKFHPSIINSSYKKIKWVDILLEIVLWNNNYCNINNATHHMQKESCMIQCYFHKLIIVVWSLISWWKKLLHALQ